MCGFSVSQMHTSSCYTNMKKSSHHHTITPARQKSLHDPHTSVTASFPNLPSWRPLSPVCRLSGGNLQSHDASRLLLVGARCFLMRLRRLEPWRQQTVPIVETKASSLMCGIRRASRPFTLMTSASDVSRNLNNDVGLQGAQTLSGIAPFRPSVVAQSHVDGLKPPRCGGSMPSARAFFSIESQKQMVLESSPCSQTSWRSVVRNTFFPSGSALYSLAKRIDGKSTVGPSVSGAIGSVWCVCGYCVPALLFRSPALFWHGQLVEQLAEWSAVQGVGSRR